MVPGPCEHRQCSWAQYDRAISSAIRPKDRVQMESCRSVSCVSTPRFACRHILRIQHAMHSGTQFWNLDTSIFLQFRSGRRPAHEFPREPSTFSIPLFSERPAMTFRSVKVWQSNSTATDPAIAVGGEDHLLNLEVAAFGGARLSSRCAVSDDPATWSRTWHISVLIPQACTWVSGQSAADLETKTRKQNEPRVPQSFGAGKTISRFEAGRLSRKAKCQPHSIFPTSQNGAPTRAVPSKLSLLKEAWRPNSVKPSQRKLRRREIIERRWARRIRAAQVSVREALNILDARIVTKGHGRSARVFRLTDSRSFHLPGPRRLEGLAARFIVEQNCRLHGGSACGSSPCGGTNDVRSVIDGSGFMLHPAENGNPSCSKWLKLIVRYMLQLMRALARASRQSVGFCASSNHQRISMRSAWATRSSEQVVICLKIVL